MSRINYPTRRLSPEAMLMRDTRIADLLRKGYPHKTIAIRLGVSPYVVKEAARRRGVRTDRTASRNYYDSGDRT